MLRYAATASRMPMRARGRYTTNPFSLPPRSGERRFKSSTPFHQKETSPAPRSSSSNTTSKPQHGRADSSQEKQRQRYGNNNITNNRSNGQGRGPRRNEAAQHQSKPATTFRQTFKVGPPGAAAAARKNGPPQRSAQQQQQQQQQPTNTLRKQPPFPAWSGTSALHSNLQGSSSPETETKGLVEFFRERLGNSQQKIDSSNGHNNKFKASSSLRQSPAPRYSNNNNNNYAPRQSTFANNGNNNNNRKPIAPINRQPSTLGNQLGLLQAAKKEATLAQTRPDRAPAVKKVPSAGESQQGPAGAAKSSTTTTSSSSNTLEVSPLQEFITQLKQKAQEDGIQSSAAFKNNSGPRSDAPSWRKHSMNNRRNNNMPDRPFFARNQEHPQRQQQQKSAQEEQKEMEELTQEMYRLEKEFSPPKRAVEKPREVVLPWTNTTMVELSKLFGVKVDKIISVLQDMGEDPKRDDSYTIDTDMMEMVAMELDINFIRPTRRQKEDNDHKQLMERRKMNEEDVETSTEAGTAYQSFPTRPPVVCIMGHVDHGKTTLMDALRRRAGTASGGKKNSKKSSKGKKQTKGSSGDVAGTEAGGITQIISAFQVPLGGQTEAITFLDTPGHAAFSAMRQSGSHAADILVLVVAADDGVSPQTVEIINFYKSIVKDSSGGISMVVAMNKIDKPGIDVEESKRRVENQLLEHGIIPEGVSSHSSESEYGSPVQFFPISAKTGDGLEDLIEGLALQSEVMDLRADDNARAEGIVMDARVEQGLGVVADCIVRWGSIEKSDVVVSGTHTGKVRILKDVNDKTIKKGTPSQPVRIIGFKTPPKAGDPVVCVASEEVADDLIARRIAIQEKKQAGQVSTGDSNANFSQFIITGRESMTAFGTEKVNKRYDIDLEDTGPIRIPIIVKAKADGSVAAVRDSLLQLGKDSSFNILVDTIGAGVGPLTKSEIEMAKESNACVFCFDVKNQDKAVLGLAESEGVRVMEYDVIYSLLDDAKEIFMEFLPPVPVEVVHGKAAVEAVFSINGGKDAIAGLKVTEGTLYKNEMKANDTKLNVHFRVIRDGERVTSDGETVRASSLRKFKEDVENVRNGEECGLGLSGFIDFQEGDVIECYSVEMKKSFA